MQIITYNEALTQLCDWFDAVITPRTIARTNTNIFYLLFKAFAKGWEVINNVCVAVSNKFDPANCSDEDLVSVAYLVGTEKKEGASSGLLVTAVNNGEQDVELPAGVYTYALDEDTSFVCTLTAPLTIAHGSSENMTFLSVEKGSFPITEQQDIVLTGVDTNEDDITIPSDVSFSNANNASLLGYTDETDAEFRKRILEDTDRQDSINELKLKLRNLPYVFDCEIVFNQDTSSTTVGDFTIEPYYMLILISTSMYTEEIAKIVAESAVYPTVNVENESHEVDYNNAVFASGKYPVFINDFTDKEFTATVTYQINTEYISENQAKARMRTALYNNINGNTHKDAITSDDFFTVLGNANITGVKIFGVTLMVDNAVVPYVSCLKTEIGKLVDITFNAVV